MCSKPTYRAVGASIGKARPRDGSTIAPSVVLTQPFGSPSGICQQQLSFVVVSNTTGGLNGRWLFYNESWAARVAPRKVILCCVRRHEGAQHRQVERVHLAGPIDAHQKDVAASLGGDSSLGRIFHCAGPRLEKASNLRRRFTGIQALTMAKATSQGG